MVAQLHRQPGAAKHCQVRLGSAKTAGSSRQRPDMSGGTSMKPRAAGGICGVTVSTAGVAMKVAGLVVVDVSVSVAK